MIETTPTAETIEQRLAELQTLHADLTAALAAVDAELATADEAVAAAQAVFDAVIRAGAEAQGPAVSQYDTWTPKTADEERERSSALQRAEGMREQADKELGAALVNRTNVAQRRGHHLLMLRRAETEIAEAERDLEHARQTPARDRDLLAKIRARVLGEPAGAA